MMYTPAVSNVCDATLPAMRRPCISYTLKTTPSAMPRLRPLRLMPCVAFSSGEVMPVDSSYLYSIVISSVRFPFSSTATTVRPVGRPLSA